MHTPHRSRWLVRFVCLACLALLLPALAVGAQPDTSPPVPESDAAAPQNNATTPNTNASNPGDASGANNNNNNNNNLASEQPAPTLLDQSFTEALHTLWTLKLFKAGETDILLNQLIIALLVVVIGLWVAKQGTLMLSGRLVRVSKISESVAFTLGKVVYYFAAAIIIFIALQVAGIPTTVFTVLGGALAIGVGFGAQNLFNNLISGIIILTEKPIRRGDIVEIDGMEGKIAEIGNRRTRIRRFDGIDVLVPNSTFLETNVINWTLHDALIRGSVNVGVAYGSPVKQVRDLMLQAAKDHDKIENTPPPAVLFTDFGDNSLNFLLYFWTQIQTPMDRKRLESDLRFTIDELFANHKITIAFPQRDVHLDTLKPLEVRMIDRSAGLPSRTPPAG